MIRVETQYLAARDEWSLCVTHDGGMTGVDIPAECDLIGVAQRLNDLARALRDKSPEKTA